MVCINYCALLTTTKDQANEYDFLITKDRDLFRFHLIFRIVLLSIEVDDILFSIQKMLEVATPLSCDKDGLKSYYVTKIEELQLIVTEKTQNLRRLQAQRNELNAKGKSIELSVALMAPNRILYGSLTSVSLLSQFVCSERSCNSFRNRALMLER